MKPMITAAETRQPPGLYVLFFTELWERYGFYSVQALLILFLTKQFLFSDEHAYGIFGAYGAMIYATPVIGGYLADRLLGFRRAIFLGGTLFILGYALLAIHGEGPWFYVALAFLICGNGFFKSNISSFLGTLYTENDIRRDSGFTLFYMGINLGSFAAMLFGAYIAEQFGWSTAFGIAAIGMALGMCGFAYGQKYIGHHGGPPNPERLRQRGFLSLRVEMWLYLALILSVALISSLLTFTTAVRWGLLGFGIATVAYVLIVSLHLERHLYQRLIALLILMIFSVIFWALYFQVFSSFMLFIDRAVNHHIFGLTIPTAAFGSTIPIVIILFSPFLSWFWLSLAKRGLRISAPIKFALGIFQLSLGFLIITWAVHIHSETAQIAGAWMILVFFIQTLGELCLSPIGLSVVTLLAPPKLTGMMMGVWFLSLAAGNALAGWLANFTAIPATITNPQQISLYYADIYQTFGLCGIASAGLLVLLSPILNRMIDATS